MTKSVRKEMREMRAMKGPPVTVRCDCGDVQYVPYGETWQCERCGRRWNTALIPSEQYWGVLREMRRYRLQAMGVAVAIAGTFVALGITMGQRFFVLAPVALGAWFLWYMPQWRRKVRAAARFGFFEDSPSHRPTQLSAFRSATKTANAQRDVTN